MPQNVRVTEQQSRSVQLSWPPPYSGNSPISAYILQYKLVSGELRTGDVSAGCRCEAAQRERVRGTFDSAIKGPPAQRDRLGGPLIAR